MKKTKKAIASLAIAGMALTMIPFNALAEGATPTRLGGYTAAETAVQIADQTGWTGTAILSSLTSYGMVDALTAGPLASFLKAPILLQEAGGVLNPNTKAELTKLAVKTVYVTSGTAVISQAVLDQLTGMGITVVPLGGADRFETSVNIAKQMVALGASVSKVAVAYGWLSQDALSIAAIAAAQTEPILLTEKDAIPESVKAFLATNTTVKATDVIGGTGVISEAVKAQFPSATRQFGNTAYDTNVAVLKAFDSVLKYDRVFIANGETAIDALAGAPLAAQTNSGIVLTNGTLNEGTTYVSSKLSATSVVTALGGTAVVPEIVLSTTSIPTTPVTPPVTPPSSGGGGGGGGGGSNSDTTAPVITLIGNSIVNVANGGTYTEAGATVSDNNDTGLVVTITYTKDGHSVGSIDTSVAGTYIVHYNVSDAAGNAATEKTRTVIVAPVTVTVVSNAKELDDALINLSTTNIRFTGNIDNTTSLLPLKANHSLSIEFGGYSLTGDLSFEHALGGMSVLTGTAAQSIVGNLKVTTAAASFLNDVTVSGDVTIANVVPGTWTEAANGNKLIITDSDGGTIIITGSANSITVSASAAGTLTITINAGATVDTITCNAPVNITNNGAINALIANAAINLVANVAPGTTTIGAGGSVAVTGTHAGDVEEALALKITATTISGATLTDNTLSFSFAKLKKNSAITVSKDTKMSFSFDKSGTIGDFNLNAGSNSILNAPLPNNEDLDLSQANMTAIFSAIKDLDSTDKEAILNTVDFAEVLELVQSAGVPTQNAVFEEMGFVDFYDAIKSADSDLKADILDNMTHVIDASLSENSADFKEAVEDIMISVVGDIPALTGTQKETMVNFYLSNDTDVAGLLADLQLTPVQKESLLSKMDYTALFEAMMDHLTPETRASMFKTVNFKDLFTAIKSAGPEEKAEITENLVKVMDIIEKSDISRAAMLDALVFGADKSDGLFQILRNLDNSTGDVTVNVTLTDDASHTSTYTFIISE